MPQTPPLRFHWSLSQAGNPYRRSGSLDSLPGHIDLWAQLALCRQAEENHIDSMLMAIGSTRPDPLLLTVMLGQQTERIKFMVAVRSGLISPTYFAQQLNTASQLVQGRVHINVVGGSSAFELKYYGDWLDHDERYARTDEFMDVCRAYWRNDMPVDFQGTHYQIDQGRINTPFYHEGGPEIFLGGNSAPAAALAAKHAHCLWRFPDTPEALIPKIQPVLDAGKEVGLLVSLITRPTREGAHNAAAELIGRFDDSVREVHQNFRNRTDSVGFREVLDKAQNGSSNWITNTLWNGAVPYLGAPSVAFVGSYEDIAQTLMDYQAIGISQFLFMGWPDIEEVEHFGKGVYPLVREREAAIAHPNPMVS